MPVAITSFRSFRHNRFIAKGVELSAADPVVVDHADRFSSLVVNEPGEKRATKRAARKTQD